MPDESVRPSMDSDASLRKKGSNKTELSTKGPEMKKKTCGIAKSALKESTVLAIVALYYYGIADPMKLASSSKLSLSLCWRRAMHEEAHQVACWMLQRHCDRSLEELQECPVVKELQWSAIGIRLGVERARRKLAEGDFSLRLGIENVEQMLLATFGARK